VPQKAVARLSDHDFTGHGLSASIDFVTVLASESGAGPSAHCSDFHCPLALRSTSRRAVRNIRASLASVHH